MITEITWCCWEETHGPALFWWVSAWTQKGI